jgi:hypothetical protein
VGTSVCFVAVKGQVSATEDARVVGTSDVGWTILRPVQNWLRPEPLEQLAVRLASRSESVAIAAFVEDSDIAYVAAVASGGVVARLCFGSDEGFVGYAEGVEAARLVGGDLRSGADGFEMWSQFAGSRVEAATVRELMEREWTFAEDPIDELFNGIGIPLPWQQL